MKKVTPFALMLIFILGFSDANSQKMKIKGKVSFADSISEEHLFKSHVFLMKLLNRDKNYDSLIKCNEKSNTIQLIHEQNLSPIKVGGVETFFRVRYYVNFRIKHSTYKYTVSKIDNYSIAKHQSNKIINNSGFGILPKNFRGLKTNLLTESEYSLLKEKIQTSFYKLIANNKRNIEWDIPKELYWQLPMDKSD